MKSKVKLSTAVFLIVLLLVLPSISSPIDKSPSLEGRSKESDDWVYDDETCGFQPLAARESTTPSFNQTVIISEGELEINGEPVYLYGGELQYFRIRDENHDASVTWSLWEQTLDQMKDAGMNFVSFYIPWDYHEESEGVFNFNGSKDLDHLLDLCYQKGFYVMARPGPYIIAEWPTGPGSFGAVPQWFKDSHPETLQVKSGGAHHDQPTYLHPQFLNYTEKWFRRVNPILQKYIHQKPCIVMLQLDNEPNFLWVDHFTVDYSNTMRDYYHGYLEDKYAQIHELNSVYNSSHSSFEDVAPPEDKPDNMDENPWVWDWFDAAQCYIMDYFLF